MTDTNMAIWEKYTMIHKILRKLKIETRVQEKKTIQNHMDELRCSGKVSSCCCDSGNIRIPLFKIMKA